MCAYRGAQMVCLPENFAFIGSNHEEATDMAEPLSGAILREYR